MSLRVISLAAFGLAPGAEVVKNPAGQTIIVRPAGAQVDLFVAIDPAAHKGDELSRRTQLVAAVGTARAVGAAEWAALLAKSSNKGTFKSEIPGLEGNVLPSIGVAVPAKAAAKPSAAKPSAAPSAAPTSVVVQEVQMAPTVVAPISEGPFGLPATMFGVNTKVVLGVGAGVVGLSLLWALTRRRTPKTAVAA